MEPTDLDRIRHAVAASRHALSQTAQDDPQRKVLLDDMGENLVALYRATANQAALSEAIACAREALALTPPADDERPSRLDNLASDLTDWYALTCESGALDSALTCARDAYTATPPGHPCQVSRLGNVALLLSILYERIGEPEVLAEAIDCARTCVSLAPAESSDRPGHLSNLGSYLQAWYVLTGERDALAEAIGYAQAAVELAPTGHPALARWLTNLGNSLAAWYALTGEQEALASAITCSREAVRLTPAGHGDRPTWLTNLGNRLSLWYSLTGERKALEEAIAYAREAVALGPAWHAGRITWLSSLAGHLAAWYTLTSDQDALLEAIECTRAVLDLLPASHTIRPSILSNLGVYVRDRYTLTNEPAPLQEAITCAREAVGLTPPGHSDLPRWLNNLGNWLADWYELTSERDALAEAIICLRRAVELTSAEHQDRPILLTNLGILLSSWWDLTGDRASLQEAIERSREATALASATGCEQLFHLNYLSRGLSTWYTLTQEHEALAEAIECSRAALDLAPEGHSNRPELLSNLGITLEMWFNRTGDQEKLMEAVALARKAVELTPADHCDRAARINNLGYCLHTLYNLTEERSALAESITCARDAATLAPAGHADRPVILHNLGHRHSIWHALTQDRSALKEAVACAREALTASRQTPEAPPPTFMRGLYETLADYLMERDEGEDWEEAHRHLQSALALQNEELGRQRGERPGLDYLRDKEDVYRLTVRCCLELARRYERNGSPEAARDLREQAWSAAEQGKGRFFAAMLASERQPLAVPNNPRAAELLSQVVELRRKLSAWESVEQRSPSHGEDLRRQIHRCMVELQELDPESASLTAARPVPLSQIQAVIPSGAVLLEFYPLAEGLVLFAIDQTGLRVSTAPISLAQLTNWTFELDACVQSRRALRRPERGALQLRRLLGKLGTELAPAMVELLGTAQPTVGVVVPELILVPTGPLHRWPLHLFPWGGGVLWDAWSISYVPTADTLFYCSTRRPTTGQPLLLAPDPKLPGSFGEAALAQASGWAVSVEKGASALMLAKSTGNIALVTHVEPSPEQSGSSLVKLWVGENLGWVTAVEILQLMRDRPPAEHGEWGSCAAHYEVAREGDHLQGLTRSFLTRLRSLTSTLWPVDDLAASYVGARFRELMAAGGRSKAACLRQAALELRDGGWAGVAAWLLARIPPEGQGRCLLLALVATYLRAAGDLAGFLHVWELCHRAEDEQGPYSVALDELKMRGLDTWAAWAEQVLESTGELGSQTVPFPLTELHWGPNVLLGAPMIAEG